MFYLQAVRASHFTGPAPSDAVGLLQLEVAEVSLAEERRHVIGVRTMGNSTHLSAAGRPEKRIASVLLVSCPDGAKSQIKEIKTDIGGLQFQVENFK